MTFLDCHSILRRHAFLFALACLFGLFSAMSASFAQTIIRGDSNHVYEKDVVPNSDTAARIAEAVAIPIYGKDSIEGQKPLAATMKGDLWVVVGVRRGSWLYRPVGGVVEIQINKIDGRIVSIDHGK